MQRFESFVHLRQLWIAVRSSCFKYASFQELPVEASENKCHPLSTCTILLNWCPSRLYPQPPELHTPATILVALFCQVAAPNPRCHDKSSKDISYIFLYMPQVCPNVQKSVHNNASSQTQVMQVQGVGWNNTNTLAESPKHAKHKPGHRELLTPMYALCSTSHFRLSKLVCWPEWRHRCTGCTSTMMIL